MKCCGAIFTMIFVISIDHDDRKLRGTGSVHEAEWGDRDLEWILIDACSILQQYDEKGNWAERWGWGVFKGLSPAGMGERNER